MSLTPPNLDNRTFEQMMAECRDRIKAVCPSWSDFGESDPGTVLLELFAFLTEGLIYRQNRLPEKAFVEFLRLLGVKLSPPQAAIAKLRFSLEKPAPRDIEIPRGTRVCVGRSGDGSESVVFSTDAATKIPKGEASAEATAHHCEEIVAELAGRGTGESGLVLRVARPPVVAPLRDGIDLVVGVEYEESDERQPSILNEGQQFRIYEGKRFRIWKEVESFSNRPGEDCVFVADRMAGTIHFAPRARVEEAEQGSLTAAPVALGAAPKPGREVRVWYRRGGGALGNAAANTIDALQTTIAGVQVRVTNAEEAAGGRDGETLENALVRGPQDLRARNRAVTADDFEALSRTKLGEGGRAKALTRAQRWRYAAPGSVDVLLVPSVPDLAAGGYRLTLDRLRQAQSETLREDVARGLAESQPLGVTSAVNWARYKLVIVSARVVVYRQEDPQALKERLIRRLNQVISPLPNPVRKNGWSFGETLRAFHVHDCALNEPGVKFVDRVRFRVEEAPDRDVTLMLADPFQSDTWYAASGAILFRTLNNGEGWEPAGRFPSRKVVEAAAHMTRAGLLAVAAQSDDKEGDVQVFVSEDCGETWEEKSQPPAAVRALAWMDRGGEPILLIGCENGLYQRSLRPSTGLSLMSVTDKTQAPPVAVATGLNQEGQICVAVALRRSGVWLSREGGKDGTFRLIGLADADIRRLSVQTEGSRTFLWASHFSTGTDEGQGCSRFELTRGQDPPEGWTSLSRGWRGASCNALSFAESVAYAATHHAGILRLDTRSADSVWQGPKIDSGLPIRGDSGRMDQLRAVAADPRTGRVFCGGEQGVYSSEDHATTFRLIPIRESDQVTLPATWLFCPGEHELTVIPENEVQ